MSAGNPGAVFTSADWLRLTGLVRLVDDQPITDPQLPTAAANLSGVEILISGWGAPRLDEAALELMPRLRAVVHAAGTVKTFVTPEVFARGIEVSTAAAANAVPVARFTLATIILALKRMPRFAAQLQTSDAGYRRMQRMPRVGTRRPVIGVVGASRVGRRLLELLPVLDEFEVLLYDPYVDSVEAAALGVRKTGLPELCAGADIVTLHAPDTPQTHRMIGRAELAAMPDGAILINTARGGLVDTEALTAEVVTGRLDAYLDVTDPEPVAVDSPLRRLPNVLLTPHIAGALGEEATLLGQHAVDEIARFVAGSGFNDPVDGDDLVRVA